MLDAYTQKKILPRLVLALIGINLSWFGVTAIIEFGVIAGDSIQQLILTPFGGLNGVIQINEGAAATVLLASPVLVPFFGAGAFLAFWKIPGLGRYVIMLIGSVLLLVLAAILAAFAFMLVRQVVLIALVLVSPIAIALWVLPATSRYFETWKKALITMVLFYPIFQAFYTILLLLGVLAAKT